VLPVKLKFLEMEPDHKFYSLVFNYECQQLVDEGCVASEAEIS
jgi:hypothetical protein